MQFNADVADIGAASDGYYLLGYHTAAVALWRGLAGRALDEGDIDGAVYALGESLRGQHQADQAIRLVILHFGGILLGDGLPEEHLRNWLQAANMPKSDNVGGGE
jgi:hypothetical protein